ncbi:hypothetical protein ACSBR1_019042 [Camellia fascicularis]
MLIQMGNVYTKKIFEKFQNEYFRSIESDIEAIEYGEASTIYTVVDVGSNHARKVKMERDGPLGCNCTKFEREGILCCHSLKVITDILNMKEVPPQYILKRWTKQARAETVKDITGNDIQLATLGTYVERKLSAHFGVKNEVSNDDATQSFEVDGKDVNHVVQPKGLKKKVVTSKGKRRVKGGFEVALVANSKKKSRANSLASSKSIASPTVTPSPLSVGGELCSSTCSSSSTSSSSSSSFSIFGHGCHYFKVHVDMALGFGILKNQIVQCVVRLSTGRKWWNALEIEVLAAETVKQTDA